MRVWIEISGDYCYTANYDEFHPLMRVWIEISNEIVITVIDEFHPLMRVWIEIQQAKALSQITLVSPSYEGVD